MSAHDPLVPAEVDLRGLQYMPLFGHNLFSSDLYAGCSDAEFRAAIALWWAAWNQVPAASLPDNDVVLCRLAGLGRDVRAWKRVREKALHGFVRCTDGRLYHKFLSEQAIVAWQKRVRERERKRQWRERAALGKPTEPQAGHAQPFDLPSGGPQLSAGHDADMTRTGRGRDGSVPPDVNRRDGNRRDGNGIDGTDVVLFPAAAVAAPGTRRAARATDSAAEARARTWEAYATAYRTRYGVEPVRNATVNAQIAQIVRRIGADEAPHVAAFYVRHAGARYVGAMHQIGLLLQDAEKVRTEWATGRQMTAAAARQADRTAGNADAVETYLQSIGGAQ